MNSKQINFFLAPEDISAVWHFFMGMGCKIIMKYTRKAGQPINYNTERNQEFVFQVCLCREEYLDTLTYGNLDTRQEYSIDITTSNVIQFSIGGFYPYSNKEFHRSRLYFVTQYYEGERLFQKDEEFLNWADKLFIAFKKTLLVKDKNVPSESYGTKNFIDWVNKTKAELTTDGSKFIIQ